MVGDLPEMAALDVVVLVLEVVSEMVVEVLAGAEGEII